MNKNSDFISVIDISPISLAIPNPKIEDFQKVSLNLADALSTKGFAYLTNHGIPETTIKHCFKQSENFFKLSQMVKDKFA